GASGEPANTRAATAVSTTGDAQVATARRVAVLVLEREVGTLRKAHVVRVATRGAAQATNHQSTPTPASRTAPGSPGSDGTTTTAARSTSRTTTPTRPAAVSDIVRLYRVAGRTRHRSRGAGS